MSDPAVPAASDPTIGAQPAERRDPVPVSGEAPAPAASPEPPAEDELAVLDELEADLAAVEQAISTLEQVAGDGIGGEQAAAQIAAAVSPERFGSRAATPEHSA